MSIFYHEDPPNPPKRGRFLTSTLKEAFANCRSCSRQLSSSNSEDEDSASEMEDDQEVVVSEIRSRAMEAKTRRKASFTMESISWIFSPTRGEFFATPKTPRRTEDAAQEEREEFFSVGSRLSRCSSARSSETFVSVKTNFSRCSSLSGLDRRRGCCFTLQEFYVGGVDWQELRRRSIIQEFCHCEGWPFGLCRKALLLPPLPRSPSESWTWRKGRRLVKLLPSK